MPDDTPTPDPVAAARQKWNLATYRVFHADAGDDLDDLKRAEDAARIEYLNAALAANNPKERT